MFSSYFNLKLSFYYVYYNLFGIEYFYGKIQQEYDEIDWSTDI